MSEPRYPAARVAGRLIHDQFVHYISSQTAGNRPSFAAPDPGTIERILDNAFWASIRRDENYVPRLSLAFVPPAAAGQALVFETGLPLTPTMLVRVSSAVDRSGNHLAVWPDAGEL